MEKPTPLDLHSAANAADSSLSRTSMCVRVDRVCSPPRDAEVEGERRELAGVGGENRNPLLHRRCGQVEVPRGCPFLDAVLDVAAGRGKLSVDAGAFGDVQRTKFFDAQHQRQAVGVRVIDAVVDGEAGAVLDDATDERGPLQWAGIAGETSAHMLANRICRVQRTDAVRREFDRRRIHHVTVDDPATVGIFG